MSSDWWAVSGGEEKVESGKGRERGRIVGSGHEEALRLWGLGGLVGVFGVVI